MRLLRLTSVLVLAAACSTGSSDPHAVERVGRTQDAIINGVLDTTHPAVVALILGKNDSFEGSCTGTIIKRDAERHIGWVATAAHCVGSGILRVIQAEDYASADVVAYSVIDYVADPRWPSTSHDFAIVRIGGVDASTPVIPLTTSPDELAEDMLVTSVGFGKRTIDDNANTKRYSVDKTLAELTTELLGYEQTTSGLCHGDSGGPVIAGSGGAARVVGIHSFVAGGCEHRGYSARVTDGLDFFEEQLAKALPEPSCELCQKLATSGSGACASITKSCLDDDVCRGYQDCIAEGKKDRATCAVEFPLSEGPSVAAASCACGGACAEVCSGAAACADVGKCGAKLKADDACVTCIESSCCEEERDCTVDGRCYVCLEHDDSFPSCKRNDARKKLASCARDRCAEACAGSTLGTIGETEAPADEADAGAPVEAAPASSCQCQVGPDASAPRWLGLGIPALALALARRRRLRCSKDSRFLGR